MADTKELTENEQRALEEYATSPGWYEYPGHEGSLRKDELLAMLDGDEFVEASDEGGQSGPVVDEDGNPITRAGTPGYEVAENVKRNIREEPKREDAPKVEPLPKPDVVPTRTELAEAPKETVEVPTLKRGDKHHLVLAVKSLLSVCGYPTNTSPIFDGPCELAVSEFQQSARVPSTGVVDGKTWAKLLDDKRPL